MKACEKLLGHVHILYDRDIVAQPELLTFEPHDLAARGVLAGEGHGRGFIYFIRLEDNDWVLRHYRRGGLVARLLKDTYLWTGIERTRAWREWRMLASMCQQTLPVPRPVAARVLRRGPTYKADIITERLMDTHTLAHWLEEKALDEAEWRAIGTCIRRFHDAGVCHGDMNAHNILLTQRNDVYLIDFDKSQIRLPSHSWQSRNLARLHRSLTKLRSLSNNFHFSDRNWQSLCAGYA